MRVLVTGGTGHVECHTVKALLDAGHHVRMFVRSLDRVAMALDPLGVSVTDVVIGDVTEEVATESAIAGCDAAIHVANIFTFAPKHADAMWRVNTVGTGNVLRLGNEAGLDPIDVLFFLELVPPTANGEFELPITATAFDQTGAITADFVLSEPDAPLP